MRKPGKQSRKRPRSCLCQRLLAVRHTSQDSGAELRMQRALKEAESAEGEAKDKATKAGATANLIPD